MDYPGGPNLITGVFKSREPFLAAERERERERVVCEGLHSRCWLWNLQKEHSPAET